MFATALNRPLVLLRSLAKPLAALLLFALVFGQTEMRQLLKLPILVEHYFEHRQETPELTLLAFLEFHYLHAGPDVTDFERDQQLPFKSFQQQLKFTFSLPQPAFRFAVAAPDFPPVISFPAYHPEWAPTAHFADIWQPPRLG